MDKPIVILGGMGPQASIRLHELIIQQSRTMHDGDPGSYPTILHISIPMPDFTNSKTKYLKALKQLQNACGELPLGNAAAIGLACNTAHLMQDDLPLKDRRFVSMIKAVVDEAKNQGFTNLGILASPSTLRNGLYDRAFKKVGIAITKPDKQEIRMLNDLIHKVIKGVDPLLLRGELVSLADNLRVRGADAILLGCTELPLIGLENSDGVIDSLKVLAKAMLAEARIATRTAV